MRRVRRGGGDRGDIRCPQEILTDRRLADLIDFSEPVAFLCVAVLHFITDDDHPRDIATALRWRMTPGSYLVISHAAADGADAQVLAQIAGAYGAVTTVPRPAAAIGEFFSELELVRPGLTDVARWRHATSEDAGSIRILGGVGRKPR